MSGQQDGKVITIRAARLAAALSRFGVGPTTPVAVLCCDRHAEDRAVALSALTARGAEALVPAAWSDASTSAISLRTPRVVLACEEGVAAWRQLDGRGVIIGEGEDILWWKALECRHASEVDDRCLSQALPAA